MKKEKQKKEKQEKKELEKEPRAKKPKKKRRGPSLSTIILVTILLAGLGIMLYPSVSDWWNSMHATQAIAGYVTAVEDLSSQEREDMLEAARAYNARLENGVDYMLTEEELEEYEKLLNIAGTGIMGYVQIPSIHVNLPVYHGTDEAVLQIAAGHIAGSSLPTGGAGTHAVISGHRGLPSARLFTDLDRLVEGDIFMVTVLDRVCTYQIDQIHIVFPEEIADLAIEEGKDYMTLVTCTPYGINTHRMLIRGHRIGTPESGGSVIVTAEAVRVAPVIVFFGIAVPLLFVTAAVSLAVSNARGRKKSHEQILQEMEQAVALGGEKDEKNHEDNS